MGTSSDGAAAVFRLVNGDVLAGVQPVSLFSVLKMKRFRDPRWFLILLFLGIVGCVPLVQLLKEAREENGIQAFQLFGQAPTASNLRNFEQGLERANWLGRLTRPWIISLQFHWLKDGAEKVLIGKEGWYFYKPGLQYMLSRDEGAKISATNDPIKAIVHFRDQLAARGIKLVVMPVPNKESIYPDFVSARAEAQRTVMAPRTQELLGDLRRAEVEVIDLFKVFGEARKQSSGSHEELYLEQDTHWSPAGVDLAAKAVARRLLELGLIREGDVKYAERPATAKRLGDLLRMLQVPAIEKSIKPESVECMQVVRSENSEPYRDGAEAEVLVLGDSFLRIYQQDAPTAAGFIAHLAQELKQPLMSLVNDGGGSTLVRQELRAQPIFLKNKKVVIWEFVERDIGLGIEGWKMVKLGE